MSLPTDSNGVIVSLPSVSSGGTTSVNGILVLGIDTANNNKSSGITRYTADGFGQIKTIFNGITYGAIIDSGSNELFFSPPSTSLLPDCGLPNQGWFCPSSLTTFWATNEGASGSPGNEVLFQIGNFNSLTGAGNGSKVFPDIGASLPGSFDWGLPFYFGRNIYVGIYGTTSSLGTGPYFAY